VRNKNSDHSTLLLAIIIFIVLFSTGGAIFYITTGGAAFNPSGEDERTISTLFVFEEENEPMCAYVVFYYPPTKRASIFNIPGNVGRILKKINRVDRIDTIYDTRHPDAFVNEVEDLLSIDVNYTVIFNMDSLSKLVDIIDGVEIAIPQAIEIYAPDDTILFPSGINSLDGDKARKYISYRAGEGAENESEAPRERQDRFFIGLLKKLSEKNSYLKIPDVDAIASKLIRINTNHRSSQLLFDELSQIDIDLVTIHSIGGTYREVSGRTLLFPSYDSSLIKDIVRQTFAILTRENIIQTSGRIHTVEVLNGTNTAGLAAQTAELLRAYGYDVIKVGNADSNNYDNTQIIDHIGKSEDASSFGTIIRCENIKSEVDNFDYEDMHNYEYKADFTLIIGKDFNGRWTKS
jgi:anionic cell wall polymer biosynthesis LytR-Cps2A-Psr (LCP) family protein